MLSYFKHYFKSASFVRYVVTMAVAPLATKYGLDAVQTGSLTDWLVAGIMALITVGPAIYSQIFEPSKPALKVAVQADKIMAGKSADATVITTPPGVPNITVKPQTTRGGQG